MIKYLIVLVFTVCSFLTVNAQMAAAVNKLPDSNYYQVRGGTNNFLYAVTHNKKATIAFLGGSITFNPGWRNKVITYLKERFPDTKFRFIMAGIPSLGSLPHAFRLKRDLLDSGKVDLLIHRSRR
jgi:sialidase-1